ncbi:response regulator transcription factor [Streptomyces sp. NPDC002671]
MQLRTPRPLAVDTLIAVAMAVVAVLLGRESRSQGWPELDARAYVFVALAHLPVALRGRWPLAVFAVVQAAFVGYITLGYWPVVCTFGSMLALYTVASVRPVRTALVCAACMTGVWAYAGVVSDTPSMASVLGQALLYCSAFARQQGPAQGGAAPPDLGVLTSREVEVLKLTARGLSNLEIADRLYISEATVKTHLNRTMTKLDLGSRAQAVVVAYESGLVTPGG